jgi:hypothetical protein
MRRASNFAPIRCSDLTCQVDVSKRPPRSHQREIRNARRRNEFAETRAARCLTGSSPARQIWWLRCAHLFRVFPMNPLSRFCRSATSH